MRTLQDAVDDRLDAAIAKHIDDMTKEEVLATTVFRRCRRRSIQDLIEEEIADSVRQQLTEEIRDAIQSRAED